VHMKNIDTDIPRQNPAFYLSFGVIRITTL